MELAVRKRNPADGIIAYTNALLGRKAAILAGLQNRVLGEQEPLPLLPLTPCERPLPHLQRKPSIWKASQATAWK